MPVHLPAAPPSSPLDGLAFRALLGRPLPRLTERLGDDPWPEHVADELRAAVACGDPEEGSLWLSCDDCNVHRLVAISCKGRGFCPRCGGRRMAQGAARRVDDILPRVPVRQWVLSMPMRVRLALTFRPDLVRRALAVVVRRLQAFYLRRTGGQSGLVTEIQRFGSSMNMNLHFHVLALDGGYVEAPDGALRFVPTRPPNRAALEAMVRDIGRRLDRLVSRTDNKKNIGPPPASAAVSAGQGPRRRCAPASARGRPSTS